MTQPLSFRSSQFRQGNRQLILVQCESRHNKGENFGTKEREIKSGHGEGKKSFLEVMTLRQFLKNDGYHLLRYWLRYSIGCFVCIISSKPQNISAGLLLLWSPFRCLDGIRLVIGCVHSKDVLAARTEVPEFVSQGPPSLDSVDVLCSSTFIEHLLFARPCCLCF